jgi:DNA-binding NarL/FixJ family response regulator
MVARHRMIDLALAQSPAPIRVLVADDHAIVRDGLKLYLELEDDIVVAGEAADGREAVEQARRIAPDVVLMDLHMPELNGIEATEALRESCPAARVLVLTSFADDAQVLAAIRAGAAGYILKEASPEEVSESVRAVHRGEPLLHPDAARSLMQELSQPRRVPEGTVTILFTDIEGSSAIFERLGDDGAHALVSEHNRMLRELVETHGGIEVKHQGDGLMLAFSSARRALLCAVDIQASMIERNAVEPETALSVRIGLNTGEVISEDDDYFGSTVILAARIAAAARGGQILVSEATKAVAGRVDVPLTDLGVHNLRGLSEPCRLYEVAWTSRGL